MAKLENIRPYSQVLERLRAVGLRPTRQRLALARLLFDGGDCHVTAESLHSRATAANIKVSLATIYNTLHQFTLSGLLREIVVDASRSYFDTNVTNHHHFYLESSGRLQDIPSDQIIVANLPAPPAGTAISLIDVVIRVLEK